MYDYDHEPQLMISSGPTDGEIYLKGFSDGFHGRPRAPQQTERRSAAYNKGYDAAQAMRKPLIDKTFKTHSIKLSS